MLLKTHLMIAAMAAVTAIPTSTLAADGAPELGQGSTGVVANGATILVDMTSGDCLISQDDGQSFVVAQSCEDYVAGVPFPGSESTPEALMETNQPTDVSSTS